MTDVKAAAAIFGVGPHKGVGAELCYQAARAGHHVFVNGRTAEKIEAVAEAIRAEGGSAEPLLADVTDVSQVNAALQTVADSGLPLELAIYNAGNNRPEAFLDVTPEVYEEMWRVICFGAFIVSQATVRLMLKQQDIAQRQSLFFTGASGSLRGKRIFRPLLRKGRLRMLAQSIARELAHKTSMSRMWLSTGLSMAKKSARVFPNFWSAWVRTAR